MKVEINPIALDPGTDVTVEPIGPEKYWAPIPGLLIDAIAFSFTPDGDLNGPVPVEIEYESEQCDEQYALLKWNFMDMRYEPVPILSKDVDGNSVIYSLTDKGDYYLVCLFAEALWLKRLSEADWEVSVELQDWPGLIEAQVEADYGWDTGSVPDPEAGLFTGIFGSTKNVPILAVPDEFLGKELLEVTLQITQADTDSPDGQAEYGLLLWEQEVVEDFPAASEELLTKFAPVFQFAEGETSFPVAMGEFLDGADGLVMPSGRVHAGDGGGAMGQLGHAKAVLMYDGQAMDQPTDAPGGTIYGRAQDIGFGNVALVYSLHFPWSGDAGAGSEGWEIHRGDVKYVVIILSGFGGELEPESMTLSQHMPGSTIEYLGDEEMPIWTLGSFEGGRVKIPWDQTLRCKKGGESDANEEHPWVFVGEQSHALYPRKGEYSVTLPGGGTQFTETAGGAIEVWQPPDFIKACTIFEPYNLVTHTSPNGLVSSSDEGHLLFSGMFGVGGYSTNGLAPYGEAWYDPSIWHSFGSEGTFDPGTNCYKCLPSIYLYTIGGMSQATCSAVYWPVYYCQCSSCLTVPGDAFVKFPEGYECNDPDYCNEYDEPGVCKTGLDFEWWADIPATGIVEPNENQPLHATVHVTMNGAPTCGISAQNTAGVKAHMCASEACCLDAYAGISGECFPNM